MLSNEKNNTQYHVPGFEYMGPGTRIATNIVNNVKPTNHTDHVALHHDLDYLRAQNNYWDLLKADARAVINDDFSWSGKAMKLGLTARSLISTLTFNQVNFGDTSLSKEEAQFLTDYLEEQHNLDYGEHKQ